MLIQVDGSSRYNPGPAGIGVRVIDRDGRVSKEISRFIGNRTNNQAEYEAMLCGLTEALAHPNAQAVIQTDSALVFNQLTGRFKVKDPELVELFHRCRSLLSRLPAAELALVRREENKAADKLAQAASGASRPAGDRAHHQDTRTRRLGH